MIMIISAGFMLSAAAAVLFYYQHQQLIAMRQKFAQINIFQQQCQFEQSALVHADLVFFRQLSELNQQLNSLSSQLQQLENTRNNDGAYQHALKILEMGGNKEEIVSSCHLTNAEAELIMNLNAYRTVIKTMTKKVETVDK